MANMRPSCPLPRTPIALPGRIGLQGTRSSSTASVCFLRQASEPRSYFRILVAENTGSEKRGVDGARGADRERADRNARGHLHDREQRIDAVQNAALDRHAQHRKQRVCAATMPGRCAAPPAAAMITSSPRPAAAFAYSAIQSGVRCAETMRHSCGIASACSVSLVRSHRLPIRLAAHDHADERRLVIHGQIAHSPCERRILFDRRRYRGSRS